MMLMDRMMGSIRPSPEMASLIDSQKDSADSGVEPGFGRMGGLTTGNEGVWGIAGAGVEVLLETSIGCEGTVATGGRVG